MSNAEHYRKLERMYDLAPVNEYFKPTLRIEEGRAEVTLEVRREFFHAANALHGAVYFKLLDDAAFFAANSLVEDVFALTVSFTVYFTRPVSGGTLRARGEVVHASRRLMIAEAVVLDEDGRQVARGSGTFMRSTIPLKPEIGYR